MMIVRADDLEHTLGTAIRARREHEGWTRAELADRANVSIGAVRNLELAYGANVTTLVRVVHALGEDDWLAALTPADEFDPFELLEPTTKQPGRRR